VRNAVPAAEEDASQVGGLYPLPRLKRRGEHRGVLARRDAGVVEQHVDAAKLLTCAPVDVRDRVLIREVGAQRERADLVLG
jgi:hypothetical protein